MLAVVDQEFPWGTKPKQVRIQEGQPHSLGISFLN